MSVLRDRYNLAEPDVAGVAFVVDPSSQWSGRDSVYEVLDATRSTYAVQLPRRSGKVQFLVPNPENTTSAAVQRQRLLHLLTSGHGLVLLTDSPTSDTDWCTTSNGLPQMDVRAWVPTSVGEEWVDDGDGTYLLLSVDWVEVTDDPPAGAP